MLIKRSIKIIIIFLSTTFLLCLLFGLIAYVASENKEGLNLLNISSIIFMYIIGYGEVPQYNNIALIIFALIGIIILSIFTAHLTVNLFWKTGSVVMSNDIAIWKKADKYYLSILIGNKSYDISRLSVSFIAYDDTGNIVSNLDHELTCPLLVKKGLWKVDAILNSGFFYDIIKPMKVYERKYNIYCTLVFIDNVTMQECTLVKEYVSKNIICSEYEKGFELSYRKNGIKRWNQFKSIKKSYAMDVSFMDWLTNRSRPFRLDSARPINAEAISILPNYLDTSGRYTLTATIDFEKARLMGKMPDFAMILLDFTNPYQDWTSYYKEKAEFQFEISGCENILSVQLEIKDYNRNKIIDEKIDITETITTYTFPLDKYQLEEAYLAIKEICFTIFPQFMLKPKGTVFIESCEIYIPDHPVLDNAE